MTQFSTPEEQEVSRRAKLVGELVDQLSERELELASLTNDLMRFRQRYAQRIGRLYAELDKLDLLIANHLAQSELSSQTQDAASEALARARQSAAEARLPPPDAPESELPVQEELFSEPPSKELKLAFRKAAMRFHPDRATSEAERVRRTAIMARLNVAYGKGDLAAIEKLTREAGIDPEEITGDDVGSQLVRLIRRDTQVRRRLAELESQMQALASDEVYRFWQSVQEAEAVGADPLGELAARLEVQIAEKRIELESLGFNTAGGKNARASTAWDPRKSK